MYVYRSVKQLNDDEKHALDEMDKKMLKRKTAFRDFEDNLPHKNGYTSLFVCFVKMGLFRMGAYMLCSCITQH